MEKLNKDDKRIEKDVQNKIKDLCEELGYVYKT